MLTLSGNADIDLKILTFIDSRDLATIKRVNSSFSAIYHTPKFRTMFFQRGYSKFAQFKPTDMDEFSYIRFIDYLSDQLLRWQFQQLSLELQQFKPKQMKYSSYLDLIENHQRVFTLIVLAKGTPDLYHQIKGKHRRRNWQRNQDAMLIYKNKVLLEDKFVRTQKYPQLLDRLAEERIGDCKFQRVYLHLFSKLESRMYNSLAQNIIDYSLKTKTYFSPLIRLFGLYFNETLIKIIEYLKAFQLDLTPGEIDSAITFGQNDTNFFEKRSIMVYNLLHRGYKVSQKSIDRLVKRVLKQKLFRPIKTVKKGEHYYAQYTTPMYLIICLFRFKCYPSNDIVSSITDTNINAIIDTLHEHGNPFFLLHLLEAGLALTSTQIHQVWVYCPPLFEFFDFLRQKGLHPTCQVFDNILFNYFLLNIYPYKIESILTYLTNIGLSPIATLEKIACDMMIKSQTKNHTPEFVCERLQLLCRIYKPHMSDPKDLITTLLKPIGHLNKKLWALWSSLG